MGILLLLLASQASAAQAPDPLDPSRDVKQLSLPNGMKVILAPSAQAKTVQLRVRVRAGHFNEEPGSAGTAHLLEHYLFTDAKLDQSRTYLEAIREKGGSANAYTAPKETVYYATVPPKLVPWILDVFGRMLLRTTFEEERLQHAKKPVVLEIGRPTPADYLISPLMRAIPRSLLFPGFWESEFGVVEPLYLARSAQVDTAGLTSADVRAFYDRYYHPGNRALLLSGAFDPDDTLPLVERIFASEPAREGGGWRDPAPRELRPGYRTEQVSSGIPVLEIGAKVAGATLEDDVVARVYLGHLAHRLMRELRNTRGETYSVRSNVDLRMGFGKAVLRFEVPPERYAENRDRVLELMRTEAREGGITPEAFAEAMDLHGKQFALLDRDSGALMSVAQSWLWLDENYPARPPGLTGYRVYSKLTREDYVARLKRLFAPEREYRSIERPPFLFRYENFVLLLIAFAGWMHVGRRLLSRPFRHDAVRWVRKLAYLPAYVFQILIVAGSFGFSAMAAALTYRALVALGISSTPALISDYAADVAVTGEAILLTLLMLGAYGRKAMVVGDELIVKTLSYRSYAMPLSGICGLELLRPHAVLFSPRRMWRVKWRFEYFHPFIWREGVLVHGRDGRSFYLGFKDSRAAHAELRALIPHSVAPAESAAAASPVAAA